MQKRSALHPVRVPIRLPDGKPSFGLRWKLSVPRPGPQTPAAGPTTPASTAAALGLTVAQRATAEGIAFRADRDGLLRIHERREGSEDQREREIADVAGEELLNRADSHNDALAPAVNRLLEADPALSVHAAIVQAIAEEEPVEPREWAPTAPRAPQQHY